MLKLLVEKDLNSLLEFCKNSILGTRIACYALCYGFNKDFLTFWGSENEKGFSCIVVKFDATMTILACSNADYDEIYEFINVIGAKTIITSEEAAKKLNFSDFTVKTGFLFVSDDLTSTETKIISDGNLKEIYTLISDAIPDSFEKTKQAYLSFLSDFTYRERRGYARAGCIMKDGTVVACALTAAESNSDALLSGIACDENYRSFGYGKRIVSELTYELIKDGKRVFVIALNSSAEGFYKHIGFKECEKIAFI